jgi:hypothetical protein
MAKSTAFIEPGFQDKDVQKALTLMSKNSTIHNRHEGQWRGIQQLFEQGFTVMNPTGTKKITSKLLLQILWKVVNKLKIPDFKIYRGGPFAMSPEQKEQQKQATIRDQVEQIVTAGVATVMKEGRFIQCMRDKGGVFYKMSLFGDSFVQIGYDNDNSDYPISFRVGSLSDIYMNNAATDIRDAVGGLSADEVVIIYRYTINQFNQLFPEWEGKVAKGDIPRAYRYRKQLEKTWLQTVYDGEDMIEVAYRIGIDKCMIVFAGSACTVIDKYEGDDEKVNENGEPEQGYIHSEEKEEEKKTGKKPFPYIMDGKPYLPLLHFKFFPSSEGFYNYGIGHMVYDLAIITAQMDNMAYNHAGDNIWPIQFVNTPNKNASKLFSEILKAHEMRSAGGKGYVVSENPQGQGSGVTVEPVQSQPITGEWERAFQRLEKQIERMGFRLDMPDLGSNPNQMAILASQEATDEPIKQIMEFNGTEFEKAVEFTMDAIRKFVDDNDQTPLNSMIDIDAGDVKLPMRGFSLGNVAQELRANKYFVVGNSRNGTIPSATAENAKIDVTMAKMMPGTSGWNKMAVKQAKVNGYDLTEADMQAPQPQAPAATQDQGPQSVAGQTIEAKQQNLKPL